MDHLLLSTEKNSTLFKSHSILQESNMPNLITSDSLPDIFRKPIVQQSDTIINNLPKMNEEEKVSKWGYGPSLVGDCTLGLNKPTSECIKDATGKLQADTTFETPKMPSKFVNPPAVSSRICHPLLNQFEKSTTVESFQPNSTLEMLQNSTLEILQNPTLEILQNPTKTSDKQNNISTTSIFNTASNLYGTTQPTIKCLAKDKETEKNSVIMSGMVSNTDRSTLSVHSKTTQLIAPPTAIAPSTNLLPCSNKVQPIQPAAVDVLKAKVSEEEVVKMPPPLVDDRPLQRPAPKHKQISVNGKVYTVMKLLGRGGSSVVYQVCPFSGNISCFDSFSLSNFCRY